MREAAPACPGLPFCLPSRLRVPRPTLSTVNPAPSELAVALAAMPDVVAALVRDHVPDLRGRCIACGTPGTGTPHLPWPCPLRLVADNARELHHHRQR